MFEDPGVSRPCRRVQSNNAVLATQLNIQVPQTLAKLSNPNDAPETGFNLIYISTDYVFAGNAPENGYDVNDEPGPTNL